MSSREHLDWLLEQTANHARTFLDLWEQLQSLEVDSDEHATVEGEMLAWLHQVRFDANDVTVENDRWLDSLPDDEDEEEVPA